MRDRILRLPEVLAVTGLGRSTWYKGISQGRYPKGVKIGDRAVGWRESDILKLIGGE